MWNTILTILTILTFKFFCNTEMSRMEHEIGYKTIDLYENLLKILINFNKDISLAYATTSKL